MRNLRYKGKTFKFDNISYYARKNYCRNVNFEIMCMPESLKYSTNWVY